MILILENMFSSDLRLFIPLCPKSFRSGLRSRLLSTTCSGLGSILLMWDSHLCNHGQILYSDDYHQDQITTIPSYSYDHNQILFSQSPIVNQVLLWSHSQPLAVVKERIAAIRQSGHQVLSLKIIHIIVVIVIYHDIYIYILYIILV